MHVLFWMSSGFDRCTPSEHLLTAIIEALYENGHTVHVLQKDTQGELTKLPEKLRKLGVTCQCVSSVLPPKGNFIARYLSEMKYVFRCRKYIDKNGKFDSVFLQSTNVAGAAMFLLKKRLPDIRVTCNVQDIFPYNAAYVGKLKKKGAAFRILAAVQRYAYLKADRIITISEDMKDQLVEDGVPGDKISCIYNWSYQDEPYRADQLKNTTVRGMLKEEYFNVVYAGNIGVMQNVDILIDAAEKMKDDEAIRFHIIGDGLYKDKLKMRAQALGLSNLCFWPVQKSEAAPSIYATADINIIPLAENIYRTALPSKTATCLAVGKPVVFCFGGKTKFLNLVEETLSDVSAENVEALCRIIAKTKRGCGQSKVCDLFYERMSKSKNAQEYVNQITGMCK